jgi:transcriptional regulator with XRE-family HTH domain
MIRRRSHTTQKQFAKELGVPESDLAGYETGRVIPIDSVLRKLLPMAKGADERRPILQLLDIAEDLWDGWSATDHQASYLPEFWHEASKVISRGSSVPAELVNILRHWNHRTNDVRTAEAIKKAAAFLDIELGPPAHASPVKRKTG